MNYNMIIKFIVRFIWRGVFGNVMSDGKNYVLDIILE